MTSSVPSFTLSYSATNTRSYTSTDHFYAANNLNYYQPNIFYYHSTPWHYRYFVLFLAGSKIMVVFIISVQMYFVDGEDQLTN